MDLKVVFLVVSLMTLAIISTDASIPKCCIGTRNISVQKLLKVDRLEVQSSLGPCDIDALIVYIKGLQRPSCVDPKYRKRLQMVMKWREDKERKQRKY